MVKVQLLNISQIYLLTHSIKQSNKKEVKGGVVGVRSQHQLNSSDGLRLVTLSMILSSRQRVCTLEECACWQTSLTKKYGQTSQKQLGLL